jgi:biotin operon repressor
MTVAESILRGLAAGQRVTELPDHELAYMARKAGSDALYQMLRGVLAPRADEGGVSFTPEQVGTYQVSRLGDSPVVIGPDSKRVRISGDIRNGRSRVPFGDDPTEVPVPEVPPRSGRRGAIEPIVLDALTTRATSSADLASTAGCGYAAVKNALGRLAKKGLAQSTDEGWIKVPSGKPAPAPAKKSAPPKEERRGTRPTRTKQSSTTGASSSRPSNLERRSAATDEILEALQAGPLTGKQLEQMLKLSQTTVSSACRRLERLNTIERQRAGKSVMNTLTAPTKSASPKSTSRRRGGR